MNGLIAVVVFDGRHRLNGYRRRIEKRRTRTSSGTHETTDSPYPAIHLPTLFPSLRKAARRAANGHVRVP